MKVGYLTDIISKVIYILNLTIITLVYFGGFYLTTNLLNRKPAQRFIRQKTLFLLKGRKFI